jgi:hypothetical protein
MLTFLSARWNLENEVGATRRKGLGGDLRRGKEWREGPLSPLFYIALPSFSVSGQTQPLIAARRQKHGEERSLPVLLCGLSIADKGNFNISAAVRAGDV